MDVGGGKKMKTNPFFQLPMKVYQELLHNVWQSIAAIRACRHYAAATAAAAAAAAAAATARKSNLRKQPENVDNVLDIRHTGGLVAILQAYVYKHMDECIIRPLSCSCNTTARMKRWLQVCLWTTYL